MHRRSEKQREDVPIVRTPDMNDIKNENKLINYQAIFTTRILTNFNF